MYVNQQLTHRGNIGALVDSAGELITSEGQKADMFNVHFGSVCITDNGINPMCPVSETTSVLETVAFTQQEVLVAIKKLQSNLSSGPDGLPPLLYKRVKDSLAYPLALMFTQLFSVGIVPYEWKNAIVNPIFKKGLAGNVSNYRPVLLTCVSSKLMERIISAAIYRHLLGNVLLSSTQHGFIKGKSTCTNLLEAVNDWTLAVQNRCGINVA